VAQKAVDPPGDARSEAWFMHQLALRLLAKRNNPTIRSMNRCEHSIGGIRKTSRAIQKWKPCWQRSTAGIQIACAVAQAVTPRQRWDRVRFDHSGNPHHGPQVDGYPRLKSDGSTQAAAGFTQASRPDKINKANSRNSKDYLGHGWDSSGRAIAASYIIERAPADGEPWSDRKKLIWWDGAQKKWTGIDNPDFRWRSRSVSTNRKRERPRWNRW